MAWEKEVPSARGVKRFGKTLRIHHIYGMEVRKKPRGFKRPRDPLYRSAFSLASTRVSSPTASRTAGTTSASAECGGTPCVTCAPARGHFPLYHSTHARCRLCSTMHPPTQSCAVVSQSKTVGRRKEKRPSDLLRAALELATARTRAGERAGGVVLEQAKRGGVVLDDAGAGGPPPLRPHRRSA